MKLTLIILTFCALSINLSAQKYTDVLYLNNGSIIKGTLLENSDTLLRIETCCGSIFAFSPEEIKELAKEKYISHKVLKEKGYMNYTAFGVLIGTGRVDKEAPFSLSMEHNYRFNKNLSGGLSMGLETLNETVLPIGINGKALLPLRSGGAVYCGITGGYSISLEKPPSDYLEITAAKGGVFFNPEIGFVAGSEGNGSFFMAIGYRYNQLNYEREDYIITDPVKRKQIYNRLSIKIGICFH